MVDFCWYLLFGRRWKHKWRSTSVNDKISSKSRTTNSRIFRNRKWKEGRYWKEKESIWNEENSYFNNIWWIQWNFIDWSNTERDRSWKVKWYVWRKFAKHQFSSAPITVVCSEKGEVLNFHRGGGFALSQEVTKVAVDTAQRRSKEMFQKFFSWVRFIKSDFGLQELMSGPECLIVLLPVVRFAEPLFIASKFTSNYGYFLRWNKNELRFARSIGWRV